MASQSSGAALLNRLERRAEEVVEYALLRNGIVVYLSLGSTVVVAVAIVRGLFPVPEGAVRDCDGGGVCGSATVRTPLRKMGPIVATRPSGRFSCG